MNQFYYENGIFGPFKIPLPSWRFIKIRTAYLWRYYLHERMKKGHTRSLKMISLLKKAEQCMPKTYDFIIYKIIHAISLICIQLGIKNGNIQN